MQFQIISDYVPTGDQPGAIKALVKGLEHGDKSQVLLGVTGSGKTFTMANVIQQVQRPTLILSHNKTLVAQLYSEFKQFFPNNKVEYFVSYYDYYQPEAFIPSSNTYIEKDLAINEEIEKMRLATTSTLMSGRRDIIVVASVSCIYGAGNPKDYEKSTIRIHAGQKIGRNTFLFSLVDSLYSRTTAEFNRGNFRVKGDLVDVFPAYADFAFRIQFFGDEVESIDIIDPVSGKKQESAKDIAIFPANLYVTPKDQLREAMIQIQDDLVAQIEYFKGVGKFLEAKRLEERTNFDLEMMRELGYCSGIENYSRYMDKRNAGDRPFCIIDYFPNDFLLMVDESHVSMSQVRAMYGGDRSRKQNLVEYGFRLPSAMDNRPLTFSEFEGMIPQTIYVSATPADYEIQQAGGILVEQIIRPTGLLDPTIEVRPCLNQVDDLLDEIDERIKMGDRILVTTLTKRMAEELSKYMTRLNIKCSYIHSEVKTLDRVEILRNLRLGVFDVLIGVNLLREGLDLPEVSLVAIMDADKEGFLRNDKSLTQTIGRAARNDRGKVIMYADVMTDSMQRTINETYRRRDIQIAYNTKHGITPTTIRRSKEEIIKQTSIADAKTFDGEPIGRAYVEPEEFSIAADPVVEYLSKPKLQKMLDETQKRMQKAAKELDFMEAARLRDEMFGLQKKLDEMK
ncbi:MAG: excinuclease ABC subunit UvrB [Bacteroidetes bacterium]|nr:excinuclease ABC subunit UvrB [Bacteroidota bacterium]